MRFKFIGEAEAIFSHLLHAGDDEHPEGSTVVAKPGEEFEVAKNGVLIPSVVLHPELEAVDDEAKKLVTVVDDAARVEAARVMGDGAQAPAPATDAAGEGTTTTESATTKPAEPPAQGSAPAADEKPADTAKS